MYNLLQNKYDLHAQYFIDGKITLNHFLDFVRNKNWYWL